MRITLRLGLIATGMGLAIVLLFLAGVLRFNYPSPSRFPVHGIDVSHHQGPIDWAAVRRSGISFAFIKASEGATLRDPRFVANWSGAAAAGLDRGAYHYFSFCTAGEPQAANFIRTVDPGQRMLPPAVDVEFSGNCASPPPVQAIRRELTAYLRRLEAAYARVPIIYTTYEAYAEIIAGHFPDHAMWARDILCEPRLDGGQVWTFWQYTDRGRISGIGAFVDLNVFRGGVEEFRSCSSARRCV